MRRVVGAAPKHRATSSPAAHHHQRHVEQRHGDDHQRHRRPGYCGVASEVELYHCGREKKAHEEGPGIAQEDSRGVEVVGEEAQTRSGEGYGHG